jgi:hypothetical protein
MWPKEKPKVMDFDDAFDVRNDCDMLDQTNRIRFEQELRAGRTVAGNGFLFVMEEY